MKSAVQNIVAQIQVLLQKSHAIQQQYLADILALQSITNNCLKCTPQPQTHKHDIKQQVKLEPRVSVQDKIDALVQHMATRKQNIQSDVIVRPQPKVEKQVVIEKKPPIPTANRNQKAVKNITSNNFPPPRRNEPTGKVTQSVVRTSQKVFKPQKQATKKSISRQKQQVNFVKTQTNIRRNTIQKKQISQVKPYRQNKVENDRQKDNQVQSQNEKKSQTAIKKSKQQASSNARLICFQKAQQQIMQYLQQRGGTNHRPQLQKMLAECANEQLGNRKHEQTNRIAFIKSLNNYAASRNRVHQYHSHTLNRKKWRYQPHLLVMQEWLDRLENTVATWSQQIDCRRDPKQEFKVVNSVHTHSNQIQKALQDVQNTLPQQIQLRFQYKPIAKSASLMDRPNQALSWSNLSDKMLIYLQELRSGGNLGAQQLRGLQVLGQVGLFKSKRSPLIAFRQQYELWQEHYQ